MKTKLYVITTMSNMHVGSGEYNMGVIDNLVQRDVINAFPNINSSSLKGALREFFSSTENDAIVKEIFGSSPKDKKENMKQGSFRFFEANILSYPVRSDKAAYLRAVSHDVINEMLLKIEMFNVQKEELEDLVKALKALVEIDVSKGIPIVLNNQLEGAIVEDFELQATFNNAFDRSNLPLITKLFGKNVVLLHNDDFSELCGPNRLPVVSRNYLESGESKNLWYEEVVPRFTQFYFIVIEDEKNEEMFEEKLSSSLIQIGGNSSIGYGFSKIQLLSSLNLEIYEN